MVKILGLTAVGWNVMLRNWWEKLLAGVLLTAVILGSAFAFVLICRRFYRYRQQRHKVSKVSPAVAQYLHDLQNANHQRLCSQGGLAKEPKSFGVYLGRLSVPPTPRQWDLLSQWDIIVLDPLQDGVLNALSTHCCCQGHVLGRLDVSSIVKADCSSSGEEVIKSLECFSRTLMTSFKHKFDAQSPFTGVLLANWQRHFQPAVCNEVIKYMNSLGLAVYLELSAPFFLTEEECSGINLALTKGLVCRNATILPDGDRRNYFQMADLRKAQRALATQPSPYGSTVMMWETVDDGVEVTHAVAKRSYNWCRFNNAISWIGPEAALTDPELAATKTVIGEPLGALMWLKDEKIMKSHETWRLNDTVTRDSSGHDDSYESLHSFLPDLKAKLSLLPFNKGLRKESPGTSKHDFKWSSRSHRIQENPFSFSARGQNYAGLGCFQLGLDASSKDFADLVEQQRRLRDLDLLQVVQLEEIRGLAGHLHSLSEAFSSRAGTMSISGAIDELLNFVNGKKKGRLRVYKGLHSGFRTTLNTQFWGLYDLDGSGTTDIYISAKTRDLSGTILHTFLSSRGCSRAECFMAEMILSENSGSLTSTWWLPSRFVEDIQQLAPAETILFLQRLIFSRSKESMTLSKRLRALCEYQLLEVPSLAQLRALNSTAYLRGEINAEELVSSRLAWYRERGCQHPEPSAAISLFNEIDMRLQEVLMKQESQLLDQLEVVLRNILQKGHIDASADFFAMSIFCACRKMAISEVYLEILDRNPLPNPHSDQAACYAEMFATGSRCEEYFDMTPNVLGKILSDRYRAYYQKHQPPRRDDSSTELPTAYASKLVDLDPTAGPDKLPLYYRITFLGIFAVPALIDILLLTTIGRGLYLTAFMREVERNMATTALMLALFVTGAIGTWISSGGSYYLHSMAFPAMNMFVLTRFIAGIAVCISSGISAFIIIASVKGVYAGFIFLIYFVILSTYLSMLATLAIYQLPGFMFQSGRMVIMTCIPILFISPILTLWVGHDILVYLCVLGTFLLSLLLGARGVISQWSTWYLKIVCVTDGEVRDWYSKRQALGVPHEEAVSSKSSDSSKDSGVEGSSSKNSDSGLSNDSVDAASASLPREALLAAVLKERDRRFWTTATTDTLVKKLADGYWSTNFLMIWYCKYTRSKMPLPFSPTWNLQCNAGIDTLREMQKGLKLHNAFVHWRHAGDEVWCGVLYFVIALMDKWVALISGGSIVGLSAANSETFRLAVGFGLASYLISAVFLDGIAQPLWATANKKEPRPVSSLQSLRQVAIDDARARRKLYWKTLMKFGLMHLYGLAITSTLLWSFEEARSAVVMYLAYMGAYTGLLWYQYNRIFTGSLALKDLLVAAALGLVSGPFLRHFRPQFDFGSVIALGLSTWTVAILSIWTANVGWPRFKDAEGDTAGQTHIFHCSSTLGTQSEFSQKTLSEIFDSVSALPADSRYRLDPWEHPGVEILQNLDIEAIETKPEIVQEAFHSAKYLIRRTAELWKSGEIVIDAVPARHLLQPGQTIRAVSRTTDDRLHLFVFIGLDLTGSEWTLDVRRNCKVIAEALVQAAAESKLGVSHDHSALAELLAVHDNDDEQLSLPEGVKRQLETSAAEREKVITNGHKALLYNLLLGLNCDTDWENLPATIRSFLLKRCCEEPCHLSSEQISWVRSRFCKDNGLDINQHIARCNLGATFAVHVHSLAETLDADYTFRDLPEPPVSSYETSIAAPFLANARDSEKGFIETLRSPFIKTHHAIRVGLKFLAVSLVADPEFQRELDYLISGKPLIIRWPVNFVLNVIWFFCKKLQQLILPVFFFHGRKEFAKLYSDMKGEKTVIEKHKIAIEALSGPSTCFVKVQADGNTLLYQYLGNHVQEPKNSDQLMAVNTYTNKLVLRQRDEYSKQSLTSSFTYEYPSDNRSGSSKLPIQRQCINGDMNGQVVQYDQRGYITSGSFIKDGNIIKFKWFYRKNAKFDDELLRAEYVLAHMTIKVSWCVPPPKQAEKLDKWLPNSKVMEATFIEGSDIYHSEWSYDHRSHPFIVTSLNGLPTATPPMIQHDWFKVLLKPSRCSFLGDNPVFSFSSVRSNFITRMLGLNTHRHRISTANARTHLWKSWKKSKDLDAVTARWLDELALRSDRILRPYWSARDKGRLKAAEAYLDAQADTIMARTDVDPAVSSWTLLAYRLADLYSFGQGGDATINTRTQSTQLRDNEETLHVLAMDTGTWPNEGGGVSACRRDMINELKTIRWHVLAENANDFGLPKFQVEKNVQSLTVLPLWGLDFLTPTHGVFKNNLDSAVQESSHNTTKADIKKNFFPILITLVRCARAINLTQAHLDDATKALVDLNAYFHSSRHWSDVWLSDTVKEKWRELWLAEDVDNARPISEWLQAEHPTLAHFDQALDMWHRYLFIFSIPVPEKIPDVFQASHHFAGASYGVLCKVLRKCTLHVWDHCISWREVTVFLSSAMSFDPAFVCTSLMHLSRLTSVLILTHADVVLPCADFFNPGWEQELGTLEGTIGHRRTFARKIDPVVNGIANMERFKPIEKIKSKQPTVSMLSHVRFVKDIKNAVLAADIIVNEWGFEDYRLEIYGDMIRAPAYSVECQEIIAAKSLGKHVLLKGLGSPDKVLEDAWIFLNCSVSEGLPLAMGEAALTGVPVVCTDVGASFRVVTDMATGEKFSAVVAPNDSLSLAKAQINVLALLDEWSAFAEDEPGYRPKLSPKPTRDEARQITQRMYDKTEQRRRLGMMGRDNVLNSFSSDRYLREHEQMLWIGKYRSKSYNSRVSTANSFTSSRLLLKEIGQPGAPPGSRNSSRVLLMEGDQSSYWNKLRNSGSTAASAATVPKWSGLRRPSRRTLYSSGGYDSRFAYTSLEKAPRATITEL